MPNCTANSGSASEANAPPSPPADATAHHMCYFASSCAQWPGGARPRGVPARRRPMRPDPQSAGAGPATLPMTGEGWIDDCRTEKDGERGEAAHWRGDHRVRACGNGDDPGRRPAGLENRRAHPCGVSVFGQRGRLQPLRGARSGCTYGADPGAPLRDRGVAAGLALACGHWSAACLRARHRGLGAERSCRVLCFRRRFLLCDRLYTLAKAPQCLEYCVGRPGGQFCRAGRRGRHNTGSRAGLDHSGGGIVLVDAAAFLEPGHHPAG